MNGREKSMLPDALTDLFVPLFSHFDSGPIPGPSGIDVEEDVWTAQYWRLEDGDEILDLTDPLHPVTKVGGLFILTLCANVVRVDGVDYANGALTGAPPMFVELDAGPPHDTGRFYTAGYWPLDVHVGAGFQYPIGLATMPCALDVGDSIALGCAHSATGHTLTIGLSGQLAVLQS